jgi:hypothetical protein
MEVGDIFEWNISDKTTVLRKNWWNVLKWVTGHCNRAPVSRNRYGFEKNC